MSYYFGKININDFINRTMINIFKQLIPKETENSIHEIVSGPTYICNFSDKKVIPDIVTQDSSGSWMMIIGTPIIKTMISNLDLLQSLIKNPIKAINDLLDGSFAIFIYDFPSSKFYFATDSNTTIPVFYSVIEDGIIFCSHELALARYLKAELDPYGFSQAIQMGTVWHSYTRFIGIKKCLSTQLFIFDSHNRLTSEQYWHPENEKIWNESILECSEKWSALFKSSIKQYYEAGGNKNVICDLTAGEDSRLIISCCHALNIPFRCQVMGTPESIDVIIANKISNELGIELIEREKTQISEEHLLADALNINAHYDGYKEFFAACTEYASNKAQPINDYANIKFCGAPGGEAFRGSYYTRGKAFFPSMVKSLDYKFFIKMKFLLDFYPDLLKSNDKDFIFNIHQLVNDILKQVVTFPIGTQIDHILRTFQTSTIGLRYKNPLYLPFATNAMTRSIYCLPPNYKRGGRLTKACTELFYPDIAFIKNQNGVPTVRKTVCRLPLFMPEYIASGKKVISGAMSRLFKLKQANKWYYSLDWNSQIFKSLLNKGPYSDWFSNSNTMLTGNMYNPITLDFILNQAKKGLCRNVPILDRIITQELAARWVYN